MKFSTVTPETNPLLLVLLFISSLLVYYLVSWLSFAVRFRKGRGAPPTVPSLPLLGHTTTFAAGGSTLASALIKHASHEAPMRLPGIGFNFVLFSGPHTIRRALNTSNVFDWNTQSALLFGAMFGGPPQLVEALYADRSGVGAKPDANSNVPEGRRLMRNQVVFYSDLFSPASMSVIADRVMARLFEFCQLETPYIGKKGWVELPDLYTFTRDSLFQVNVDSLLGKNMRALNPDLNSVFWDYDGNVAWLAMQLPRWMRPSAFDSRERCLKMMKRWRRNAEAEEAEASNEEARDRVWGMTAIRRRNKLFEATNGLFDEQGLAASDLALLWTFAANLIPSSFWYLFEILRADGLLDRCREEVNNAILAPPSNDNPFPNVDVQKLLNSPLLQSTYAESVRMHVAALISRTLKQDFTAGDWNLRSGQTILLSSHVEHRAPQWDFDGTHPPTEFWAERFLVHDDAKESNCKFSLDGRQGMWLPFGLGEHLCPGRHFAKMEMMVSFAVLTWAFDFELMPPGSAGWRPEDSMDHYGFGATRPKQKVPFRIRRRQHLS